MILTRSEEDIKRDRKVFESLGFEVVPLPLIRVVPLEFSVPDTKVDYIVFQSAKAVRFFLERSKIPDGAKVVAVGEKTGKVLESFGIKVDLVPEDWSAEGIVKAFPYGSGELVLVPRSKKGREEVIKGLEAKGYRVIPLEVYDTVYVKHIPRKIKEVLSGGGFLVFASPSAVKGLFANLQREEISAQLKDLVVVAIGKTTKKELERWGIDPRIVPRRPMMEEVAKELEGFWQENC